MAKIIGLKELRENMEVYIGAVKKGKSFVVVRKSKPVFKVSPALDEWGDEGVWETIADFSHLKEGGLPADQFLKILRHGQSK